MFKKVDSLLIEHLLSWMTT